MTLANLTSRSVLRCLVLILALLTIAARAQVTPSAAGNRSSISQGEVSHEAPHC